MIAVVTASTMSPTRSTRSARRRSQKFGTDRLALTLPFPLYGIFRYLYLVHQKEGGGSPSDMLLTDRPLLVCVALWAAAVIAIIYGPELALNDRLTCPHASSRKSPSFGRRPRPSCPTTTR